MRRFAAGTVRRPRPRSSLSVLVVAALLAVLAILEPRTSSAFVAGLYNSANAAASSGGCSYAFAISTFKAAAVFEYPLTEAASSTSAPDSGSLGATGTYNGSHTIGSVTSATAGGCPYPVSSAALTWRCPPTAG